ncbi:MAG TPA: GlmL-related ornithine degradation protein [Clostridia bacterium]|nr:GlmL-related ornithine degradation protein [Clostridia bacterium]
MYADLLVAEIGSTTTLVSAFALGDSPRLLAQGQAATTVVEGDVRVGLNCAIDALKANFGVSALDYGELLASSSAAGGLKMCVHGLVYDMTVSAARAAALGAGAIVRQTTAGKLTDNDLAEQRAIKPNLILLAGGTDGGERETALYNAKRIAEEGTGAPVLYAGNAQNQSAIRAIFEQAGIPAYIAENVYPRLDALNIEPVRRVIHAAFEKHIVSAPGMEHIRDLVTGSILPTPGAVMEAAMLLYEEIGDLCVLDIGGATTDVHSVTQGSDEIAQLLTSPEPFNKRTVEGDLGLFVNAHHLVEQIGEAKLSRELNLDVGAVMWDYQPIPRTEEQFKLTSRLCLEAGLTAINRHAGRLRHYYTPQGRATAAEGKDLTQVKTLIGTGGALTRLPERETILRRLADCNAGGAMLFPKPGAMRLAFDESYIMASLGVLAKTNPQAAKQLLRSTLRFV